jgi:hypothetical protein
LIPNIEKFLPVAIFKIAATIPHKFNIVRFQHHYICGYIIYPHIKLWWYRTMLNFCVLWWPFWKWQPVEIVQCRESIRDIIIYPHIKLWWYRTILIFCDIVVAILKMTTGRNFSMSGINSGHHYLPTYQFLMISDNDEFLPPIFYTVFWQPFWKWQISKKKIERRSWCLTKFLFVYFVLHRKCNWYAGTITVNSELDSASNDIYFLNPL